MEIKQGDIYWIRPKAPGVVEPDYSHPHVVIQDDAINRSRVKTVVVCALTSNRKRGSEPGNVLLKPGEANLAEQSVVVVSQIETVEKAELVEYIGSLSKLRIEEIFEGLRFLQASYFTRDQA